MQMKRLFVSTLGLVAISGVVVAGSRRDDQDMQENLTRLRAFLGAPRAQSGQTNFPSEVAVTNAAGTKVAGMSADGAGDGLIGIANNAGFDRVAIAVTAANAGRVTVANNVGAATFALDGINGLLSAAGDVAEVFPASGRVEPGAVLVIDAARAGAMRLASEPYDRRVAGVMAGANNYRPGITLKAMDQGPDRVAVTLTGTAYCLATNANGAIKAGDLLTTSSVPGHAMKVTDHDAARGAILGKALEDLKGDKGHIMILASLQ